MDPSSDEIGVAGSSRAELPEQPFSSLSPTRQFFGRLPSLPLPTLGRRKSTGQELQSSTANPSETRQTREIEISQAPLRPTRPRSQSNASQHDWKSEWATALVAHESMQSSFKELRIAVDEYEAKVSGQKWEVLSSDWAELEALAKNAREKQETSKQPRSPLGKFMDRFSAVALEYSKLLDVVWNNSPEYAGLVWGVTKILLVANINHANLKQNVTSCLISIGERLGPVNQLVNYSPTDKMVTAVAMLYASYSKLLQKALKYYGQSKLAAALETFTFPWETKFQKVIAQIDYHFRLIYELSHANHFHAAVETKLLLQSIHTCQQEARDAFQQAYSTEKLRSEIREEVRQEICDLLDSFHCKWVQRFDEMLLHKTGKDKEQTQRPEPGYSFAQHASATSATEVFLADFVSELEDLAEFRDSVFPLLQNFQRREDHIRVTKRYLTVYDQQHILKVLRNPDMGDWMSSDNPGVMWIDTHPHSKTVDWMSVLATQLIDDASCYEYRTVLSHFCLGHNSGNAHSTISILIESLIFQLLLRHREDFSARNISLTQQRFQDAQDDLTTLWSLFLDVLNSSKSTCAWLIVDQIDILQKESGAEGLDKVLMLVRYLYELAESSSMIVKILITARLGGPVLLSKEIADASILSPAHPVIHVPKGHHRSEAAFLAKYMKNCSRLPESDSLVSLEPSRKSLSIEALLAESESEDEDPVETHKAIDKKQDSLFVQNNKSGDASEDDFASFMDEDPFASSSDEELDVPIAVDTNLGLQSYSAADSVADVDSLQDYFGVQEIDNSMHEMERNIDHEVSADPDKQTGSAKSPAIPKIVVDFLDDSFRSHVAEPVSEAENSPSQSKVALHEPQILTPSTLEIEKGKRIRDFFESDSDEDGLSS